MTVRLSEGCPIWERQPLPTIGPVKYIAIDTETYDPDLKTHGPGGVRNNGHILGISYALPDGRSDYIPIRHPASDNVSVSLVRAWWKKQKCFRDGTPIVGANLLYDLEWLRATGLPCTGPFYDIQNAEPLLNEQLTRYSLSAQCERYLPKKFHKLEDHQKQLVKDLIPKARKDFRAYLWQLPAEHVGAYAEMDAVASLKIFLKQVPLLKRQDLWELFLLESRLIPLLLEMRFRGVRVNRKAAEKALTEIKTDRDRIVAEIKRKTGVAVSLWSSDSVGSVLDSVGVGYPLTPKTRKPQIKGDWLKHHPHEITDLILRARQLDTAGGTFIQSSILDKSPDGRIYCQFNQLKCDGGGTVSGRFSSSNPNLQNVPAREEANAARIRCLFLPEPGEEWWQNDWSQVEYRLIVHYAYAQGLPKAAEARDAYLKDPKTDFHDFVCGLLRVFLTTMQRKRAKNVNFGMAYSMGQRKLATGEGMTAAEAKQFFEIYHREIPYMRALNRGVMNVARSRGYIRTLLNRRRRFDLWEPKGYLPKEERQTPLPKDQALVAFGPHITRAYVYKAMNALIQGGAADVMKKSMVDSYEDGVYNVLGIPSLTVHDELDGSKPRGKAADEALRHQVDLMNNAIPLSIPLLVDCAVGRDWWNLREVNPDSLGKRRQYV